MSELQFPNIKKVYVIGIKGSGVISLVEILHAWGKEIVGSDVEEKFYTDEILQRLGIKVYEGFSVSNLQNETDIDLVLYSTAYAPERNEELKYALENGLPCLSYPEAVGEIMKNKYGLAVCGTHGKTTTTAMLTLAMQAAGTDPTAVIGSKITQLGSSGLAGKSQYFIIEADEYQNKFLHYNPMGVILTSADFDHPDYFENFEVYKNTFKEFIKKIPPHGFLVVWGGSIDTLEIAKESRCKIIVYGDFENNIEPERIYDELIAAGKQHVEFISPSEKFSLTIPGRHNVLNATAVLAVCRQLKLDEEKAIEAMNGYQGTSRRFEKLGEYKGAEVIDDYAHHPAEIRATLAAARERYSDKNIICIFHPHTFTRTKALLEEFANSFEHCNEVIILDIYGSAREKQGDVHAKDLVERVCRYRQCCEYIPTIDETYAYLKDKLGPNDVLITMGAGNVNELGMKLLGH